MSKTRPPPDPVYLLRGAKSAISYLKFKGTDQLFSGTYDGNVHTWSMERRRISHTLAAHDGHSVLWIDFTPDSNHMLTQGRDGYISVWSSDEAGWTKTGSTKCCDVGFCNSALLGPRLIAIPSETQSMVDLLDFSSGIKTCTLQADFSLKIGMCMKIVKRNEDQLLVGYEDGTVVLWDKRDNKRVSHMKLHNDAVMCLDYNPAINRGFSASVNDVIKSWSIECDTIVIKSNVSASSSGFSDCKIRGDGKIVAFAGWDSNIRVFGAKHLKPLAVLSYHKKGVQCVAFSSDNLMACGSKEEIVSLWELYK